MRQEMTSRVEKNSKSYAVLLNANAKQWTGQLHEKILGLVPSSDLFLTQSFSEAEIALDKIIVAGYEYVLTGGGDGSITYLMNLIDRAIRDGKVSREKAPKIGVLKMGTGNALARWLEAEDILVSLERWRSGGALSLYDIYMISDENELFPFAGCGLDAEVINDYGWLKDKIKDSVLENFATGALGYGAAILCRTLPKQYMGKYSIAVDALDEVIQIRPNGDEITRFKAGERFFEGTTKIVACGAIPYWGYNIRMFPCANLHSGMFQFRTFDGSILQLLRAPQKIWKGDIGEGCHDYLCKSIRITMVDDPMPYEVAGDTRPKQRSVVWKIDPYPVTLVVPHLLQCRRNSGIFRAFLG